MNPDEEQPQPEGNQPYLHICSQCGFSDRAIEPVIQHIVAVHDGDGHVMEMEAADGMNVVERFKQWLR